MDITIGSIGSWFTMPTVRRTPVIVDIGMFSDSFGQDPFVDVASWERGVAEIGCLVRVVELQAKGFRHLVI